MKKFLKLFMGFKKLDDKKPSKEDIHLKLRQQFKVDIFSTDPKLNEVANIAAQKWVTDRCRDIDFYLSELFHNSGRKLPFKGERLTVEKMHQIKELVLQFCKNGQTTIYKTVQNTIGTEPGLAKLVVTDGNNFINSQITKHRQKELEIQKYRWNAICNCHKILDDVIFSWDEKPPHKHPGEPILCKCWAEAVLPNLDDLKALFVH